MNHRLAAPAGAAAALAALAAMAGPIAVARAAPIHAGVARNVAAPRAAAAAAGAGLAPAVGTSGPGRQVLLINGDRVLIGPGGMATGRGLIIPAAPGGLAGSVTSMSVGGSAHDIPTAAMPYLGHGLDPRLFDVKALLAAETRGRLPVRVTYHGRLPVLPGITITRSGGGTADGYLTDASAKTFGAALDRQFVADHRSGSFGTDGLFAGGTVIGLPGMAPLAPPHPDFPMHTLTVKGFNLAGKPDTGDGVGVFSVDNTNLPDSVASVNVFDHGVAKFSLPAGHYLALGVFAGQGFSSPVHLVVLPQFTVHGDQTVTVHESAAASKVTMVTPRPATVLDTDFWLSRTGTTGPPDLFNELILGGSPLWVSPTRARPSVGTMQVSVNQHLESPPGHGVPYEYTLSQTFRNGIIPSQRFQIHPGGLAVIHERFYQPVKAPASWSFHGSFPGTNPESPLAFFGFVDPFGRVLAFPGRLTEFAGGAGTARMEWNGDYLPSGASLEVHGGAGLLHPGEHLAENWAAGPLHPAASVKLQPEPNAFLPFLPSAVRSGNTLGLDLSPFDDSQPGHQVFFVLAGSPSYRVSGRYEIDQNGTKIAGGDAVRQVDPEFDFHTTVPVSARPSTIRLSLDLARASASFPLSTSTRTVWTWRSAPRPGAALPVGWTCTTALRVRRDCDVEPMMMLGYGVAGLALNGSAPAGHQVVHLTAGHLQRARASTITHATMQVSFDGGKTWHPAHVSGRDGSYAATFSAPAGAKVSLRTSAADAAGGSITETVINGYLTAP